MVQGILNRLADEALGQDQGRFAFEPLTDGSRFESGLVLTQCEDDGIGVGSLEFALRDNFLRFVLWASALRKPSYVASVSLMRPPE